MRIALISCRFEFFNLGLGLFEVVFGKGEFVLKGGDLLVSLEDGLFVLKGQSSDIEQQRAERGVAKITIR